MEDSGRETSQAAHLAHTDTPQMVQAESPVGKGASTDGERRIPSISILRYSLLSGMDPASATDNMTYCTEEHADEIKGTGAHALQHYEQGRTGMVKEIGRRTRKRGEWEEKIGMGAPRQTKEDPPHIPWGQQGTAAPTSEADPEKERTPQGF